MMTKNFLWGFAIAISLAACSGNKADGKGANGEDTLYQYSDTSKSDSLPKDTMGKDAYEDSTSNAPRMPGGN